MSRFFVPPGSICGDHITINGKEAHHIVDVMRLSAGDKVIVFDGTGTEYEAVIDGLKSRSVILKVTGTRRPVSGCNARITLIQAITKKDKMDYIIEKATELGAGVVVPVMAARTIPQWDEKKTDAHIKRWNTIAQEAAKQCGRADMLLISPIKTLASAVADAAGIPVKVMAALSEDAEPLKNVLSNAGGKDVAIAIGPEGDFTAEEILFAKENGFSIVSLGPRVLKSDTAGLAVLSMVNYEFSK